ncbi:hypothetical protein [Dysosmobacter sp.]|uniref:hypothetical protein n=1 Tax=Dysosmobacter sp. TaxID=2591382 RepID=UPI002A94E5A7|nr:hypothetical protein [Dysosmobacter sp.]MDY5510753.1 hypothetical protein [Dysosmobacter sp.]
MEAKDTDALAQQLSEIYYPLEMKSCQILQGLQHRIFESQLAYYSGHYRKSADGTHRIDYFPLPIIMVDGFSDIVIDLDCVTVTSKLRRENALAFAYEQLGAYEFEICGEDDDTLYHHHPHADTAPIRKAVLKSSEKNFKFSFCFDFDVDGDAMYEFVKLLRRKGFFY